MLKSILKSAVSRLVNQGEDLGPIKGDLNRLSQKLDNIEERLSKIQEILPVFVPSMTVEQALSKGASAVFESMGLKCVGCPVAKDETLSELADGHDIPIIELILKLNNINKIP